MRHKTIEIYLFEELSDSAKEKARMWYRTGSEYPWGEESISSLKAFAEWFGVEIRNYSLGGSDNRSQGVEWRLNIDDALADLKGVRLWKYLNNHFLLPKLDGSCPFTGYCMDEVLLDPIREFMTRPNQSEDYEGMIEESIHRFCKSYADDVDYYYSDEQVDESIIANEYEFLEDGSRA